MKICFEKLNTKSIIRKELLRICEDDDNWVDPVIGTFLQKRLSRDLIYSDPLLKNICDNYMLDVGFSCSVTIFMLKPWTHYMLHHDIFRPASINLMINDFTDSISYFQVSEPYNKLHIGIEELDYEQDSYYLFNSKIPHAVTNKGSPRYVLSISLKHDYYRMRDFLKDQLIL